MSRIIPVISFLIATSLLGQTSSSSIPTQTLQNAYWSTGEFQSTVQLHNNLTNDQLTVQTVLHTSDGTQVQMPPVTLKPLGNATVNINQQLPGHAAAGSATFTYQRKFGGALSAEMYVESVSKSLSFTIPSAASPVSSLTQDAVFWLASPGTEVYLALQNTSAQTIHATPSLAFNGTTLPLSSVTIAPYGAATIDVTASNVKSGWIANAVGGITVTQDGPAGALNTGGWVEDDALGYSTTMTFANPARKDKTQMTTQVLVGDASQIAGFSLQVNSSLVIWNFATSQVAFTGQVSFSDNEGTVIPVPLQLQPLGANEVRRIDLNALKSSAGVPSWYASASIALSYPNNPGALMARVYGSSPDGQYGFYWALQNAGSHSYDESYWSIDGAWTTVMAVGNFAQVDDSVTVVVTTNSGNFTLPAFPLHPGESRTINVRDLLLAKDTKGNPFPAATSGGFRISGKSTASSLIVKEHLLNAALKLATPFYGLSPYVTEVTFFYSSYGTYVGGSTVGVSTLDYWSNETQEDGCPYAYSSDNTSITTVTKNGCVGVMTAVAVGSTTIWAYEDDPGDGEGDEEEFDPEATAAISPGISFGGNDVTGKTTTVVVGQQIVVSATGVSGISISSQGWSISTSPPSYIGSYTVVYTVPGGSTSATTSAPTLSGVSSATFYYTSLGTSTVTYSVTSDGQNYNASTTFTVVAPTGSMTATALDATNILINGSLTGCSNPCAHYGPNGSSGGVHFVNSYSAPSGYTGSFQWVQIGTTSGGRTVSGGSTQNYGPCGGLDTTYPYDTSSPTNDSPGNELLVGYSDRNLSTSYTMTLMFKPSPTGSIFVPVVSVNWSWGFDATSGDGGHNWTFASKSAAGTLSPAATTTFPVWSSNLASCGF